MYRLTPVDAYQENLVKHIEVASITSNEASTKPYVRLVSVSLKKVFTCRLEIYINNKKTGVIDKKTITAKTRDDLWELSNEVIITRIMALLLIIFHVIQAMNMLISQMAKDFMLEKLSVM